MIKTLLAILLLIPSLSWGDHNKIHADFQNQIEEELRNEGHYDRTDLDKTFHQNELFSLKKEKEDCANAIQRSKDLLISQNLDPDEFSSGKHYCEEHLEITMMIFEKGERQRIERITTDLLYGEILRLNEQKTKSNNHIEIKKLESEIADMVKKYDMYLHGREYKKKECFYTATCGFISITNNPFLNKPNLNTGGIDFSINTNKTSQFSEPNYPTSKYVPYDYLNNLPTLGEGFSASKPYTEPFIEGTGLNYNDQFWE